MPQAMWFGLKTSLLYKCIIYIAIAVFSITKGRQTFINRVEQVQRYQLSRQISCVKCKPATHPLLTERKRPHLSVWWIQCTADHYICIMHACALIVLVVRPLLRSLCYSCICNLPLPQVSVCVCVCVSVMRMWNLQLQNPAVTVSICKGFKCVWGVGADSQSQYLPSIGLHLLVFCSFATSARVLRSGRIQLSVTTELFALRHIYGILWPQYLARHQEPVFFCLH